MVTQDPTQADGEDWVRPVSKSGTRADGVPDWIGPYRVLRVLGQGSAGIVVLAERGDRQVAVKILLDQATESHSRFLVETRVASKLQDPGLVPVLDVGSFEGHPYYAMEYCPGLTLQERLRTQPLFDPLDAAQLVRELARTLSVAHAQNILHRDLKPANVILQAGNGRPRITDFGVARDRAEVGSLTRSHDVLGTPLYMAPETFEGSKFVDARSDVYALGVILYQCLTGHLPYQGHSVMDLAQQIRRGGARPPRALAPLVPRRLDALCMRALAREPDRRPADAGELLAELDAFLRDPQGSDVVPAVAPARRPVSSRRAAAAPAPAAGASAASGSSTATTLVLGILAACCLTLLGSTLWAVTRRSDAAPEAQATPAADPGGGPALVQVTPESAPALDDSLRACRQALARGDVEAWLAAREAAAGAAQGPEREQLEAFLGAAWREQVEPLEAEMRALAPYDPGLAQRGQRLERLFPERAGEALLLTCEYQRRRARYRMALQGARRLVEAHREAFGPEGMRLQVLCHWRMGSRAETWMAVLEALAREGHTPAGAYGQGVRAFVAGDAAEAMRAADRCLELDPDYLCAKILKVWILGTSGNYAQAEAYEATFADAAEDDPYLLVERMRRHVDQGFHHRGFSTAQTVAGLVEGRDAEVGAILRRLETWMRGAHRANLDAARKLQAEPGDLPALVARGVTSLFLGELDKARADLREAQRVDPERFDALLREQRGLNPPERAWIREAAE